MYAGPLADNPVTASISFSSTTTVLPTTPNSVLAISRCRAVANFPLHKAVMPQPTTQGVLGMARTTGTARFNTRSIRLVGTDAATEMMIWFLVTLGRICSTTWSTICGFTHSRMMSALRAAARLSVVTGIPSFLLRLRAFSSCWTVATVVLLENNRFSRSALSRMPPIFPAPSTATRFLEKSDGILQPQPSNPTLLSFRGAKRRGMDFCQSREEPRSLASLGMTTIGSPLDGRTLFCDQVPNLFDELRRWHVFGLLLAAGANVHFAGFRLFVADHQQERHFLHGVLADLGIHLLVAGINLDAHSDGLELIGNFIRVLDMALGDRNHHRLHR